MKKNDEDRRVAKTKKAIQDALLSLMFEKQYNRITIQNIIDRADVGRSTFYSHFVDKDDLLLSCIEFLLEMIKDFVIGYAEQSKDGVSGFTTIDFFDHLQEHSKLLKGLLRADSSELFFSKVGAQANKIVGQFFAEKIEYRQETKVPLDILINHISGTLINMIKWWIASDMRYSPAQMDEYYKRLISPCFDKGEANNGLYYTRNERK